jgi:hypothetical protein
MSRRIGFGFAAVALAVLLATYPVLDERVPKAPLLLLAAPAVLLYVAGVTRLWPDGLPISLALLALEYLASVYLRGGGLDLLAPPYAVGLFLCAELGWLALEAYRENPLWRSRGVGIALLAAGGFLVGLVLLAVAMLPFPGGTWLTAVGVLAAVAASAALGWLARATGIGERQF